MITPSSHQHPSIFLRRVASDLKLRFHIKLQQLEQALRNSHLLTTINDRSLLLLTATELIFYQYTTLGLRLKSFHGDVCRVARPQIKKRIEGEQPPKRQRKRQANTTALDIEQIASDSITNPSHLQEERKVGEEDSKNASKDSKPSKEITQPNIDFNAQLQKMGAVQIDPMDMQHPMMNQSSQNTTFSASSSSNGISNLPQKLRIIGGDVSVSMQKRTVPKRRNNAATATIKRKNLAVDQSTILNETFRGIDPRSIPAPTIKQKTKALDQKAQDDQFNIIVNRLTENIKNNILSLQNIRNLKDYNFMKRRRNQEQQFMPNDMMIDYQAGQTQFEQTFEATSIPKMLATEDLKFDNLLQEELSSNFLTGKKAVTLKQITKKTGQTKTDIFMRLLFAASKADWVLEQNNPENFGEIVMKMPDF